MTARSARIATQRPFYDLHADAYDALVTDPVGPWVEAVHSVLPDDRPASILDAGCGTGRHAAALAHLGHRVTLLDASTALLAIAGRRNPGARLVRADICDTGLDETFDAVACRGVLNDLLDDEERDAALASFSRLLEPDRGMLVLDLREARASRPRADGTWRSIAADMKDGASLRFSSRPSWRSGLIVVDERYELLDQPTGTTSITECTFTMRPWTRGEVQSRLARAGFSRITVAPGVGRRTADRLLVSAQR